MPDPWDKETTESLNDADAVPLCLHCLAPQEDYQWICPNCGNTIGPYTMQMPYLYIFGWGRFYLSAVDGSVKLTAWQQAGVASIAIVHYHVFSPFFLYRLWRAAHGKYIIARKSASDDPAEPNTSEQ